MSDAKLRDLERRFSETNSPADEALYLRERLRTEPADADLLWRMLQVLPADDPDRAAHAAALLERAEGLGDEAAVPGAGEGFFPRRLGSVLLEALGEWEQGGCFRAWHGDGPATVWIVEAMGGTHRPDPAAVEADLDRCQTLAHPNLLPLRGWSLSERPHLIGAGTPDGVSLLRPPEPLTRAHALRVLRQVCDAVAVGHREGLAHGDVSAASIRLDAAGDALLRPFGQAYLIERQRIDLAGPPGGTIAGPLHLRSPEELQGTRLSPRSDVFQLGILAFWLLTERQPFQGSTHMETLRLVLTEEPPFLGDRALDELFEVALARDPADRFPDAGELADALSELSV